MIRRVGVVVLANVAGSLLASCDSCDSKATPDAAVDGGVDAPIAGAKDAFDVWREMQATFRASPDHRPARADALVAAGEANAVFAFVRDEIALIPGGDGFDTSEVAMRWGAAGTLRGGMGTMRERVELLAALFGRMGITTEIWAGEPEVGYDVNAVMARGATTNISWDTNPQAVAEWRRILGTSSTADAAWPQGPVRADAIAAQLLTRFPSPAPDTFFAPTPLRMPFVRAQIGGSAVDFNPNVLDAVPGAARVQNPGPAVSAATPHNLTVRLVATRTDAPSTPVTLVSKTWPAQDIVGTTISASLAPAADFAMTRVLKLRDAESFVPMLYVRGPGLSETRQAELSAVGDPITRGGRTIGVVGGSLDFGEGVLAVPPTSPALLAQAAAVTGEVDAVAFPYVELAVRVNNNMAQRIAGLAADAFSVSEDGAAVAATVRRTSAQPPRVLLMFDRSTSLPEAFLQDAPTVGHDIAAAIFAALPGAKIQVSGMDFLLPTYAGGMVGTITEVDAQLALLSGNGSEVWGNLAAVDPRQVDVVIAISDFVAEDVATPERLQLIADGAPVLAVAVGAANLGVADDVAAKSGGQRVNGVGATDVATAARGFALARHAYDYRIVYRAPTMGNVQRFVQVGVDNRRLVNTLQYVVPPAVRAPSLASLQLVVDVDGREQTVLLAGKDPADTSLEISPAALADVEGALFGRAVLAVEAGMPSMSMRMNEALAERFAFEPAVDAANAGDASALDAAMRSSRTRTPNRLRHAFAVGPRERTGPATYPDGLGLMLYQEKPRLGVHVRQHLNILALTPRRVAIVNRQAAYEEAVRRTAYLAAIEERFFPVSTPQQLGSTPLVSIDPASAFTSHDAAWDRALTPFRDYRVLGPATTSPRAFWAVHPSGSVLGGLFDGSGGGVEDELRQLLENINTMLDAVNRAGEGVGISGFSVWTQLERIKAAAVINATITLLGGDGDSLFEILHDAACDAADEALAGEIPGWDAASGPFEDVDFYGDIIEAGTGLDVPDIAPPAPIPPLPGC